MQMRVFKRQKKRITFASKFHWHTNIEKDLRFVILVYLINKQVSISVIFNCDSGP